MRSILACFVRVWCADRKKPKSVLWSVCWLGHAARRQRLTSPPIESSKSRSSFSSELSVCGETPSRQHMHTGGRCSDEFTVQGKKLNTCYLLWLGGRRLASASYTVTNRAPYAGSSYTNNLRQQCSGTVFENSICKHFRSSQKIA